VPKDAQFVDDEKDGLLNTRLQSSSNIIKILITITQLMFSITTLYRARGDQISHFGYASFGLTVIPYAVMSLINLCGNLVCPQYSSVYLVRTKKMVQAESTECVEVEVAKFEGFVATLKESSADTTQDGSRNLSWASKCAINAMWLLLFLAPTLVSILIIGLMTNFQKGKSTVVQRVLTMTWLGIGGFVGVLKDRSLDQPEPRHVHKRQMIIRAIGEIIQVILMASFVAGFWVVTMEILDFGTCIRVTGHANYY